MAEQLFHLADIRSASVRVVPFDAGAHRGLVVQSFTLFEFPALHASRIPEPPVVFVESFRTGSLFLEDDSVIQHYRSAVANLRQVALDEDGTRLLVQQIAEEYAA
jgi:hypothetical protein